MRLMTRFFVNLVQKYLPDPFLFAVILTFVVFIGGVFLTDSSPLDMVIHWGGGFWGLLTFSMQMVLVLVTGHALANSPIIKKFLQSIARRRGHRRKRSCSPHLLPPWPVGLTGALAWWWAPCWGGRWPRDQGCRLPAIDCRRMGFLVWHGGLAGSIPLALATETDWSWAITGGIMVGETIFSAQTLAIAVVLILTLPLLARFMMPKEEETFVIDPDVLKASEPKQVKFTAVTPAEKVENSWIFSLILFVGALAYLIYYFINGGTLNLNVVNFIFLFAGIALHGTPRRYIGALYEAVKNSGGIILQFPFYAGNMGMMTGSGLAKVITNWFSPSPLLIHCAFSFISGRIINIFVPSGGGQCGAGANHAPRGPGPRRRYGQDSHGHRLGRPGPI